MLVSLFTLIRVSVPARLGPEKQAAEHRITPFDQEIPVNDQDDTSSRGDNEWDEENDAMILEKGFVQSPPSILKQIVSRHMHPFREHHLEITTPPPKS